MCHAALLRVELSLYRGPMSLSQVDATTSLLVGQISRKRRITAVPSPRGLHVRLLESSESGHGTA